MNELSIRVTHRIECDGKSVEKTIDIETIPEAPGVSQIAVPPTLANVSRAVWPRDAFRDAYEGAREDLQDWKGRALRAEAVLRCPADSRIKIAADGTHLSPDYAGTDHVAVLFPGSGVMFAVESLGDPNDPDEGLPQAECIARCEQYHLFGRKWSAPTRTDLISLVDDTRRNPAIDTNYFPRVKPRLHWTCTDLARDPDEAAAGSSAFAWFVHLYYGVVSYYGRNSRGFGLPVCRVGQ